MFIFPTMSGLNDFHIYVVYKRNVRKIPFFSPLNNVELNPFLYLVFLFFNLGGKKKSVKAYACEKGGKPGV